MGVGWSPLAARLVGRRHLEMERIRVGTSPAPARSSPTGRDLDHLRRHCAGDRPWVADRGRSHGNGDEPVSGKRELQRVRGVGLPSRALRRLDTWSRSNCRGVAGAHAARSMARQKEPARDGARGPGLRGSSRCASFPFFFWSSRFSPTVDAAWCRRLSSPGHRTVVNGGGTAGDPGPRWDTLRPRRAAVIENARYARSRLRTD